MIRVYSSEMFICLGGEQSEVHCTALVSFELLCCKESVAAPSTLHPLMVKYFWGG